MHWNFILCDMTEIAFRGRMNLLPAPYYLVFKQACTSCGSVQMFLQKMVQLSNSALL